MNDTATDSHNGWILLSDALDRHLPPTRTVHHIDGCQISNGRNQLRRGSPEDLIGKVHCLRCEARLGHDVKVARAAEGAKVEVRIPPHVLAQLDELAHSRGRTRAATLREVIARGLLN